MFTRVRGIRCQLEMICCVVVEKQVDQVTGSDVVVGLSARWILDTHFDRRAGSSAANESDFVA